MLLTRWNNETWDSDIALSVLAAMYLRYRREDFGVQLNFSIRAITGAL